MKAEKWIDAVGTVDDDILETFVKQDLKLTKQATRYKNPVLRKIRKWTPAIAACLCFAICISIALHFLPSNSTKYLGKVNLVDRWNEPEKGMYLVQQAQANTNPESEQGGIAIHFGYYGGIAVVAKIAEILPDVYMDISYIYSPKSYRVLRLEVSEVICGKNIPNEIYYCIPTGLDPDLTEYETIVFAIQQIGIENYPLLNDTTKTVESFPHMFVSNRSKVNMGSVLPFTNGIFDMRFLEKDGWNNYYWENYQRYSRVPIYEGCTLEYTKEKMISLRNELEAKPIDIFLTVSTSDLFQTAESLDAIYYIAPFNNGVFNQLISYPEITQENTLAEYFYFKAHRVIGGFYANEAINIYGSGEVQYEGERFTQEDLENIPDLAELIDSLDIDHMSLPHISTNKPIIEKKVDTIGKYIKNNGVVYGHIELRWEILVQDDQDLKIGYDYLHYIVMSDGSYRQIEPNELKNYLGDYLLTNNESYGFYPYAPAYP
ncbi:MAG: hypothetical protein IJX62_03290 [Clostridia bacterium]|nr:hypothetical protein [Clostridia bacterium]